MHIISHHSSLYKLSSACIPAALTQNCHHFRFKCITTFGSVIDPDVTTSQVSTTEVTSLPLYTTSSSHYTIDGNLKSIPKINTAFNACNRCITVISSEFFSYTLSGTRQKQDC